MNDIFERFFDLFISLWTSVDKIFPPIIDFITKFAADVPNVLVTVATWIMESLTWLLDALKSFFNFDWVVNMWEGVIDAFRNMFNGFGWGSSGGGGGGGGSRPISGGNDRPVSAIIGAAELGNTVEYLKGVYYGIKYGVSICL